MFMIWDWVTQLFKARARETVEEISERIKTESGAKKVTIKNKSGLWKIHVILSNRNEIKIRFPDNVELDKDTVRKIVTCISNYDKYLNESSKYYRKSGGRMLYHFRGLF